MTLSRIGMEDQDAYIVIRKCISLSLLVYVETGSDIE